MHFPLHQSPRRRLPTVMCVSVFLIAMVFVSCGGCAAHQHDDDARVAAAVESELRTRLALHVDPLVDMYYFVRHQTARPDNERAEAGFENAVGAARRIQGVFGRFGGWGFVDTQFLVGDDLDTTRTWAEQLSDPIQLRSGRKVHLRDDVLALIDGLEEVRPRFLAEHWPQREAALQSAVATLNEDFLPRHREALSYMLTALGISDPEVAAPVFLVSQANPPGAFTFYLPGGQPASVVSIEDGVNPLLYETMLHEATHVLDMAGDDPDDVFTTLRSLLEARGIARRNRLHRDVPHTLMFIQAGETVRRIYDPDHVDYGAVTGLYDRSEPIASIERELWHEYLNGAIDRNDALQRIVDAVLRATKRNTSQ